MKALADNLPDLRRRSTSAPKWMTYNFDQCADMVFKHAGRILNEIALEPLEIRMKAAIAFLPLALKRIPDKHEVLQLTLSASEADMSTLLALAKSNVERRQSVVIPHIVQPQASIVSADAQKT